MQIKLKPQIVQKEVDCEACITGNGGHSCNQTVKISRTVEFVGDDFIMETKENGKFIERETLTPMQFNKVVTTFGILEATK